MDTLGFLACFALVGAFVLQLTIAAQHAAERFDAMRRIARRKRDTLKRLK